jgi:AcrR family transcriptional regulator
LPYF